MDYQYSDKMLYVPNGTPPDELEASPAGSRSDDYSLAFLWFSAPPPPKLRTILVCCCCSNWPGLPEPPSLRSKTKRRSQCFRALPANENSPPFTGELSMELHEKDPYLPHTRDV